MLLVSHLQRVGCVTQALSHPGQLWVHHGANRDREPFWTNQANYCWDSLNPAELFWPRNMWCWDLITGYLSDSCQILSAFAYFPIGCGFKLWQTANSCADTETQVLNFRSRGVVLGHLGHLGLVGLAAKRSAITEPVQNTDGYKWIQSYDTVFNFLFVSHVFKWWFNNDGCKMAQKNEVINPSVPRQYVQLLAASASNGFKNLQNGAHSELIPFSFPFLSSKAGAWPATTRPEGLKVVIPPCNAGLGRIN